MSHNYFQQLVEAALFKGLKFKQFSVLAGLDSSLVTREV